MNPFGVKTLARPGLLRRMVGGKLRENAFIEIENLLASKTFQNLSAVDIKGALVRPANTAPTKSLFACVRGVTPASPEAPTSG